MDASLTTREFARMIAQSDIDVEALEDVPLDDPLDKGTGAGVIFGTTGGVMTGALRTAAAIMTGLEPRTDRLRVRSCRRRPLEGSGVRLGRDADPLCGRAWAGEH